MTFENQNLIDEIRYLLQRFEQLLNENKRLRQAIIVHTIESGDPIIFLSDLDFDGIDFDKVKFGYGETVNILNGNLRAPITDLETLKKVYGKLT